MVFTPYSQLHNWLYNRLGDYEYKPSQATLEQSSQDAYGIISLMCSKAAVWTVDDVAHLIEI